MNCVANLLRCGIRNHLFYQALCGILENAGRIAFRIANNHAAGDILCIFVHAGELQSERIRERHVTVQPVYKNRPILSNGINQLASGQSRGRPVFVIPTAARDPAACGKMARELSQSVAKLLFAFRVAQLRPGEIRAARKKVNVSVVESGQNAPALQIDHRSVSLLEIQDFRSGSDRHDAITANRHGFGLGLPRVDGPEFAICEEQGYGSLGSKRKAAGHQCRAQQEAKPKRERIQSPHIAPPLPGRSQSDPALAVSVRR